MLTCNSDASLSRSIRSTQSVDTVLRLCSHQCRNLRVLEYSVFSTVLKYSQVSVGVQIQCCTVYCILYTPHRADYCTVQYEYTVVVVRHGQLDSLIRFTRMYLTCAASTRLDSMRSVSEWIGANE